jgi:hypothetical protein
MYDQKLVRRAIELSAQAIERDGSSLPMRRREIPQYLP